MIKTTSIWLVSACALFAISCEEDQVAGLKGRWSGKITCAGEQTSDLKLSLKVEEELVLGDAQIFTKNSKSDYEARGGHKDATRLTECNNNSCQFDADCNEAFDKEGALGNSRCNEGLCDPCFESNTWQQVTLTLKDENVQLPDPILELWRYSDIRMEGTIKKYCTDEELFTPQVQLTRE